MASQEEVDQDWGALADLEAVDRETKMLARYSELAATSEEERQAKLRAMARAEYALPDEMLRLFTVSRMRTWLTLDYEKAASIAQSYDAIMQGMPGAAAMRRVTLVQQLVAEFSAEEEARLRELVPKVFAGAPGRMAALERPELPVETRGLPSRKPWWAFWRKA